LKRRVFAIAVVVISILWCFPTGLWAQVATSDSELQQGVEAYKDAKYQEAIQYFQAAVSLDPQNKGAHAYLANSYSQLCIPGVETPENLQVAQAAIEQYHIILGLDPQSVEAVKGIAYIDLQMKKFEEAKKYYAKATELTPNDPETYYTIGVIDWTQVYQPRMDLRAKLGLPPDKPLINSAECWQLRSANQDGVEDGIKMLTEALKLGPDYDDAMAYMNLMYRERADIQCNDEKSYKADITTADKWVDLTMATKKRKAENSKPSGETGLPQP
jgi:tetratricopeptide (TPR) repeat protein